MKKTVSLILCFLMIAGLFVSCSESGTNADPSAQTQDASPADGGKAEDTPAETEYDRAHVPDNLPALDFGGETVVIHSRGDSESVNEVVSEELTGEAVADSVYERNEMVSDRLNVKIECFAGDGWENYNSTVSALRSSIMSADGAYDIIAGWSARIPALSLEGLFLDYNKLPYIDFGQPWWNDSVTSELQIGNKLYFITGDIARTMLSAMCVYAFNQKVAVDEQIENLYDVVNEHRWTIDYVYDLTSKIHADSDGNGKADQTDYWGLVTSSVNDADGYMQGSLVSMVDRDEEGYPVLSVDEEFMAELVTKVYRLMWENEGCYAITGDGTNIKDTLAQDKALLATTRMVAVVSNLGDMESDYGILPYPLVNENQEHYGTRVQDAVSLWCVPIDAKNSDMSCAVMEALAAQSWRTTTPVYFDMALKSRYSRDPETSAMMDLIKDSVLINFESLYNESIGNPWFVLRTLMPQKKDNFASYWASNKKVITKTMEKAMDKIRSLD